MFTLNPGPLIGVGFSSLAFLAAASVRPKQR
jgi:hypothetical protein